MRREGSGRRWILLRLRPFFHRIQAETPVTVLDSEAFRRDMKLDSGLNGLTGRARSAFVAAYGNAPKVIAFAPGRVNLIGEHTDYNDGFVFPVAIDRRIAVAMGHSKSSSRAVSESFSNSVEFSVSIVGEIKGWGRFPSGVAWTLLNHGHQVSETCSAVVSNLPDSAGLSSSAALELAYLNAYNALENFGLDGQTLARFGQECEHQFVGVNCGIMDQLACALGREGHALMIDTRSLEVRHVPLPAGVSIVVCDTGKQRNLATSGYNQRRAECEEAARLLGIKSLREASLDIVERRLGGTLLKRARHVVSENTRCLQFARALERVDLKTVSRLMQESHSSLRDDYEVSCPELDAMATVCQAAPGSLGARMTGAGFGGACVSLVESSSLPKFMEHVLKEYGKHVPGGFQRLIACNSCDGARII